MSNSSHRRTRQIFTGWGWFVLLLILFCIVILIVVFSSCDEAIKTERKPTMERSLTLIFDDERVPLEIYYEVRDAWKYKTSVFLKAIKEVEDGPPENPYNLTSVFIIDACEHVGISKEVALGIDRSDEITVAYLVLFYGNRYGARSTFHMAALFRGGCRGWSRNYAQRYAMRVCNLVEFYIRK